MKTVKDILEIAMPLMDIVPINGIFDTDEKADYEAKAPYILNQLQSELIDFGKLYKTTTISRKYVAPLIGEFEAKEHDTEDVTVESNTAKAYYFEVCGSGTAYIEDYTGVWNTLSTITFNVTIDTAYYGLITPTEGATRTRIRFSGSYYYTYRNYALYKQNFLSSDNIPAFRPYVKQTLPSDFDSLIDIVGENGDYNESIDFRWESIKDLYIPYNYDGNIRITYRFIPTTLTAITDVLSVDDTTAVTALANGLASQLTLIEKPELSNFLNQRFEELKIKRIMPTAIIPVQDIYGGI